MSCFLHTSVLEEAVLSYLQPKSGGLYVDGTVGGAGHSSAILERCSPSGRLVGIDRDPHAIDTAKQRLASWGDRCVAVVHGCFADVKAILAALEIYEVDGIVVDLGVSSPQLDQAGRGFSFSHSGPLDMRMDPTSGDTALALIRNSSAPELANILRAFGEERYSTKIATRIKDAARAGKLNTTAELAELVFQAIPAPERRKRKVHPATKTFQALRIAVNRELEQLAQFLAVFPDILAPGGRCVVISFHSLEDRLVKNAFRDLAWSSSLPPDLARQAGERINPICRTLTRKVVMAQEEEISRNPRARSARLRACEKAYA